MCQSELFVAETHWILGVWHSIHIFILDSKYERYRSFDFEIRFALESDDADTDDKNVPAQVAFRHFDFLVTIFMNNVVELAGESHWRETAFGTNVGIFIEHTHQHKPQ